MSTRLILTWIKRLSILSLLTKAQNSLKNFNPYTNQDGSVRYVNATTASKSAGVKSLRDDRTVMQSYNGSPMVLDQINTGDGQRSVE